MVDTIAVILIVGGAVSYIIYRYGFKKSGSCNCGCGEGSKPSGSCCGGGTKTDPPRSRD